MIDRTSDVDDDDELQELRATARRSHSAGTGTEARRFVIKQVSPPTNPPRFKTLVAQYPWPPQEHIVTYLAIRLVAHLEDESEWSDDVLRAVREVRASMRAHGRDLMRVSDALAQFENGRRAVRWHLHQTFKRIHEGQRLTTDERSSFSLNTVWRDAVTAEAKYQTGRRLAEAEIEQSVALPHRGRRRAVDLEDRSVADGWNWRRKKPSKYNTQLLRLEVAILRHWRSLTDPNGPGSVADALAVVLIQDLKRRDPKAWKRTMNEVVRLLRDEKFLQLPAFVAALRQQQGGQISQSRRPLKNR